MPPILLVDDDIHICKLIRNMLEQDGYPTVSASNGSEAMQLFKDHRPDLVITDIVMPDKDGLETIMELKKTNHAVKIIAISGGGKVGPKSYLSLAERLGAAATLEKPIDRDQLLATVNALLSE